VTIDTNVNQDKAVDFLKTATLMRKLEIKNSGIGKKIVDF
jgi:hypothetical protein